MENTYIEAINIAEADEAGEWFLCDIQGKQWKVRKDDNGLYGKSLQKAIEDGAEVTPYAPYVTTPAELLARTDSELLAISARTLEDMIERDIAKGEFVAQNVKDKIAERKDIRSRDVAFPAFNKTAYTKTDDAFALHAEAEDLIAGIVLDTCVLNTDQILCVYRADTTEYATAVVINIADNKIELGTPLTINAYETSAMAVDTRSTEYGVALIVYRDSNDSNIGKAVGVSVVGDTITKYTVATITTRYLSEIKLANYDIDGIALAIYKTSSGGVTSFQGEAQCISMAISATAGGVVTGVGVGSNTAYVFKSDHFTLFDACRLDDEHAVFVYDDYFAYALAIEISGTVIAFTASPALVMGLDTQSVWITALTSTSYLIASTQNIAPARATPELQTGTLSGTALSFGDPVLMEHSRTNVASFGIEAISATRALFSTRTSFGYVIVVVDIDGEDLTFPNQLELSNYASVLKVVGTDLLYTMVGFTDADAYMYKILI